MADWIHKEGHWEYYRHRKTHYYTDLNGEGVSKELMYSRTGNSDNFIERSFTEWLNWHCEGGWEVFKISRDFRTEEGATWCIFRKKTE